MEQPLVKQKWQVKRKNEIKPRTVPASGIDMCHENPQQHKLGYRRNQDCAEKIIQSGRFSRADGIFLAHVLSLYASRCTSVKLGYAGETGQPSEDWH